MPEDTKPDAVEQSVPHREDHTPTANFEKTLAYIAQIAPHIDKLAVPIKDIVSIRTKETESNNTLRTIIGNGFVFLIVLIICLVAAYSLYLGQGAIGEKIMIGLLGFLGGSVFGARSRT